MSFTCKFCKVLKKSWISIEGKDPLRIGKHCLSWIWINFGHTWSMISVIGAQKTGSLITNLENLAYLKWNNNQQTMKRKPKINLKIVIKTKNNIWESNPTLRRSPGPPITRGQSYKRSSCLFKACLCPNFLRFFNLIKKFKHLDYLPGAQKKAYSRQP